MTAGVVTMDKIVALCKRRGFIFPASEIYGGIANTYDYGHYGVLLKNNVVNAWWKAMIQERDDIVALDSAIIQHPRTWEASGHLAGFTDPLVQCLGTCKRRFREDHLRGGRAGTGEHPDVRCGHARRSCPGERGRRADRAAPVQPDVRDDDRAGQGGGLDRLPAPRDRPGHLPRLQDDAQFARKKPPFGIAQVGKSFRNEITPGNFIFRTLEFEQMEMEFFVPPDEAEQLARALDGGADGLVRGARHRARQACACARTAPTSCRTTRSATSDIEYLYPIGWSELEGIANRGDFDLTQHAEYSGQKLEYVDTATGERYVPHVIEPAAGVGRTVLALLCDAYDEEEIGGEQRTVLRLQPAMAPVKVAVLPLVNKDGSRRRRARSTRTCARACPPSTTPAARSASATAARTRSARPGA